MSCKAPQPERTTTLTQQLLATPAPARPAPPTLLRHSHPLLAPLLSKEPAAQLIRQTSRQQWRLIALNLGSSLVEAFSEGATLAVVFLAVEVLSAPGSDPFSFSSNPLLSWSPGIASWLNSLPSTTLFLVLLALAVLLQALQSITRYLNQVSLGYFAARCRALVTAKIHSQVLRLSFPCASGYKVGDLTDLAALGPEAIRIQIEQSSYMLLGLLLSSTYLAVLIGISPWLLLAVAVMGLLIIILQKQLLPRISSGSQSVSQTQVAISTRITEDIQALRLLHSSGQLDEADQRLLEGIGGLERHLRGQARRMAVVAPFAAFLPIMLIASIAALSLLFLGERNSGVLPGLVTFVLALQRLSQRISNLAYSSNLLSDNKGRMTRLNSILSSKDKQFRRRGGIVFTELQRSIRFEGVALQYAPNLPAAVEQVSFDIRKGQTVALVGPSGAGKSSIADMLVGLYTPSSGRILVDGIELEDLNLSTWQQRLGVVSQDIFLFNATLKENIAFGTHGVSDSQIQLASEAAQAHNFIQSLPDGYDTLVGERGYRLSGGQRQRISLARAILRNPELLILDEATSALDSQSERLIHETLENIQHNNTVLVIAHRLSTIVRSDQILVFDHGRIVETGTHDKLVESKGLYAQLWQQQSISSNEKM